MLNPSQNSIICYNVIKCLNQIISENEAYFFQLFQEENLKENWQENQDSSVVERQAGDLEVRVRIPVQVQIFLLKFNNEI